jgi:tripartite-type tricarboxylate transporter receptor subunit TctC
MQRIIDGGSLVRSIAIFLVALASLVAPDAVQAQGAYPNRPVKLVVGFPPGSAADVVARIVSARLGDSLGQPVVVENKPGAGSNIATESVARAPADGYTLFMGTVANTINASLSKNLNFDFARDLVPVAGLASVPNLLVVHPSLAVRSVQELIAAAKARPGEILYGSSGNGTSPHLSGELFNLMAGVKLGHVPYKGSPQAMTDLLAGRVLVMFSPASTALPHIKASTLRAIASSGTQRTAAAPDLPTISESGLPGFETSVWFGLVAPAGTPREIVERLNREAVRALAAPELKSQFAAQGIDTMGGTPEQFAAYIREETGKWARVVQASGAKID